MLYMVDQQRNCIRVDGFHTEYGGTTLQLHLCSCADCFHTMSNRTMMQLRLCRLFPLCYWWKKAASARELVVITVYSGVTHDGKIIT